MTAFFASSLWPRSLDGFGIAALQAFFVVAAVAPFIVVLAYRIVVVAARRREIADVMSRAFGPEDRSKATPEQRAARRCLDDNPYISDLSVAFELFHSFRRYVFPLILMMTLIVSVVAIGYVWVRVKLEPGWDNGPIGRLQEPIIMAFAGGYVWSVYQLIMRAANSELGPGDLYEISLGLIASVPIGYAFSYLTAAVDGFRNFSAFAASAYPLRETQRLIQEYTTRKALGAEPGTRQARPTERHLGTAIEGVSDQALVRLAELRIVTVLDMAYSDPIKIMVQTGYALPVIIDWMDQSLWALYAGELRAASTRIGLRCSLDVCEFVETHHLWDAKADARGTKTESDNLAIKELATTMGIAPPALLEDLMLRIYGDPQVRVLRPLW